MFFTYYYSILFWFGFKVREVQRKPKKKKKSGPRSSRPEHYYSFLK